MEFEDLPRSEEPPQYFVFEDERTVCENLERVTSARLTWAALTAHDEANLEYRMPVIRGGAIVAGMGSTAWGSERRFTVFSRGYMAATVLPYGTFGGPPEEDEPTNRWDAPGMLWLNMVQPPTRHDVNTPLPCSKQPDGAYHSVLSIRKLTPEVGRGEPLVFRYQVWMLGCAIHDGRLNAVSPEIREGVCDAVARQHDCWSTRMIRGAGDGWQCGHKPTFEECSHVKGTPCYQIREWVEQKKR